MQEVCIADADALSRLLPGEPCLPEGCNCQSDGDCPGENGRCQNLIMTDILRVIENNYLINKK